MFYGASIKPGATVELKSGNDSEILHLSQACLNEPKDGSKTYLQLKNSEGSYTLCSLQKDTCEHANLDLFLQANSGVKFTCKGKNEIHIVGYWEPRPDADSDDDDEGMEGLDVAPDASKTKEDASDDESLEMLGGDDDDDDDDDEDDDDDNDDEEDDESEVEKPKGKSPFVDAKKVDQLQKGGKNAGNQNQKQNQKNKQNDNKQNENNAKRKQDVAPDTPNKKAKGGAAAGETQKYKNELIEFLKKNGKTPIGALGSKVKKPASVTVKLGQFLKDEGGFKVEGGNVMLAKA